MIYGASLTGNPYLVGVVTVEALPTFYGGYLEITHSWEYIKETWSKYP